MRINQILVFILFLGVAYYFYRINNPLCQSCRNEPMQVATRCIPALYNITYNRLSCFCDTPEDWKKLSLISRKLRYMEESPGAKYPKNLFGTKIVSCSDDDLQYSEFNDENVFLYLKQDTSKAIYDGALKELFINDGVGINYKVGLFDVGNENRRITRSQNGISIKYLVEYDELNSHTLILFQQAIHHDSTYQKLFKEVNYQLVRKQDNKHHASIRYQDHGSKFYLDIL